MISCKKAAEAILFDEISLLFLVDKGRSALANNRCANRIRNETNADRKV
ncbi:hypothetical protein [Ligilactobacillus ruminis]|nr:hypothetical protein [Ligilactobacillus ruminis]